MKPTEHGGLKYASPPSRALRLNEVAGGLGMGEIELARRCGLSRSTYYRRKLTKAGCSDLERDLIERHWAVFEQAKRVFEDADEAREWLRSPQYGLGGKIPLDEILTTAGFREVEKLLTRIDFGVYV